MTIRTFSSFKFGTETFGLSDESTIAWGVEVDWDQDGIFTGSNEAGRMTALSITRGKQSFIKPRGQGFEGVRTGKAIVTLRNNDGRYNPYNQSSPLYPNVTYGADVRIKARDTATDTTYPLFYGVISDIKFSGYGKDAIVRLYIEDGVKYLRDYVARVALAQDVLPSASIGTILDYVGWPARWGRSLTSNSDNIAYFWASGNKSAMSVIDDIVSSFLGYFFVSSSGAATYVPRTSIVDSGLEYDEDYLLKDLGQPLALENNKNIVRIKAHPRTAASTGVIWQLLGDIPSVQTGSSNTIWANYTYSDIPVPADSVITPTSTTDGTGDYVVNTQSDGLGTDITESCPISFTDFGDTAKIVITNNSGSLGYITKLQIRGDAIYEQNNADIIYPADISTITQPRELFLDLIWQQNTNVAQDFSDLIGAFMTAQYPFPVIKIDTRPGLQFSPELFDIVTVYIQTFGISGASYRVAGIEHETRTDNCQSVLTTLYLEPYISFENFWTFPIADFGTDTKFGA